MAPAKKPPLRHYLQFRDLSRAEYEHLFTRTRWIKDRFKRYQRYWPLEDRTLAMIIEKPSTRTRLSFEAGMHQLGGAAIYLYTRDSQLGRGEPVEDAAQVISRMCDLVMIRTFEQKIIERFAANSRVPVINGLTNDYHPCQVLADVYTFVEHRGAIGGKTVAWIGDANNMCRTWRQAAEIFDFQLNVSAPPGYELKGRSKNCRSFADPMEAARGAHLVTTEPTFCRTTGGTLRSLYPSTARRGRNGRRPNKQRIAGLSAIAGRETRGPSGRCFALLAPACVASRLCCRAPRSGDLSRSVL